MIKKIIDDAEWIYAKTYSEMLELGFPMAVEIAEGKYTSSTISAEEIAELARLKHFFSKGITDIETIEHESKTLHYIGRLSRGACSSTISRFAITPREVGIWLEPLTSALGVYRWFEGIGLQMCQNSLDLLAAVKHRQALHQRIFLADWENGEAYMGEEECYAESAEQTKLPKSTTSSLKARVVEIFKQ